MYNEKLKFNPNGGFTVLQVSDAQDMHIPRRAMFAMLGKIYDKIKPDLIVLTGDNILGNHLDDAPVGSGKNVHDRAGTLRRMKKALALLLEPIEKRKIPFAFIYGNHDDMNRISKREQAEIYKSYECCVPFNESDSSVECDTCNVPIYSRDGTKKAFNIWLLDCAGSDENGKSRFACVKPETLEWYEKTSNALKEENGGKAVMSLMFQHIPVPQTKELFCECGKNDDGSVLSRDGKYYRLDRKKAAGFAFEYPETTTEDFGQLETIKRCGDVCALVFGHDHLNSFSSEIDGVRIIQTPGASFRSYGNKVSRGVRIFRLNESRPEAFETFTLGYFDVFGKNPLSYLRYFLSADECEKQKAAVLSGITATAAVSAAVFFGYHRAK